MIPHVTSKKERKMKGKLDGGMKIRIRWGTRSRNFTSLEDERWTPRETEFNWAGLIESNHERKHPWRTVSKKHNRLGRKCNEWQRWQLIWIKVKEFDKFLKSLLFSVLVSESQANIILLNCWSFKVNWQSVKLTH